MRNQSQIRGTRDEDRDVRQDTGGAGGDAEGEQRRSFLGRRRGESGLEKVGGKIREDASI